MLIEITQHGTSILRDHQSIKIKTKDETNEIPIEKIDAILISGNSIISSQVIRLCHERNVQIVFSDWSGKPYARLWNSSFGKTAGIRRRQYLLQDGSLSNEICKEIVLKKLQRQKKFGLFIKKNRKSTLPEVLRFLKQANDTISKIIQIPVNDVDKKSLRGYEGNVGRLYFAALSSILPPKWKFIHRSQHPAKDGFNAVLNYAYGIGYTSVEKVIILSGLDPNSGFFHSDSYSKPTLSYDLIETVRPFLDEMILPFFTKKIVNDSWFESQGTKGIFLSKKARKEILDSFQNKMRTRIEEEIWNSCRRIIDKLDVKA